MYKAFAAAAVLSASLAACGGGGGVDMSSQDAAIKQAMNNIVSTAPPGTAGATVYAEGVPAGFVAGTYDDEVAKKFAQYVVDNATALHSWYNLLLSANGLHITVQSSHPVSYIAKLTSSGLVVVRA